MAERESLLGKLSEYIDKERKSFTNIGPNRDVQGVPKSLTKLYHVPAFVARLKDAQATGEQLLSDLGIVLICQKKIISRYMVKKCCFDFARFFVKFTDY